jgi:hypothetical protein
MTYRVEVRPSLDVTEEEVRRRLAACYSLLLDLARKRKREVSGGDSATVADTPGNSPATECQGSDLAESELDTGEERGDQLPAH